MKIKQNKTNKKSIEIKLVLVPSTPNNNIVYCQTEINKIVSITEQTNKRKQGNPTTIKTNCAN